MAEETVHRGSGESRPEEVTREKEERRPGEVRREEVREERGRGRGRRVRRVEVEERRRDRREELTIVDMGKKSRKAVRDLRRGKGRLMDDVEDTIEELRDAGAIPEGSHPVVLIVERQPERGGMFSVFLPPGLPGLLPMGMRRDDDDDDEDDEDDDD